MELVNADAWIFAKGVDLPRCEVKRTQKALGDNKVVVPVDVVADDERGRVCRVNWLLIGSILTPDDGAPVALFLELPEELLHLFIDLLLPGSLSVIAAGVGGVDHLQEVPLLHNTWVEAMSLQLGEEVTGLGETPKPPLLSPTKIANPIPMLSKVLGAHP